MAFYKPIIEQLEAYRWNKNGDMPGDGVINNINEGAIVKRHITHGHTSGHQLCKICDKPMKDHGIIRNPVDSAKSHVCPGDYVEFIRDAKNRITGYKAHNRKIFELTYVKFTPEGIKQ